jgi:hypothetical protein
MVGAACVRPVCARIVRWHNAIRAERGPDQMRALEVWVEGGFSLSGAFNGFVHQLLFALSNIFWRGFCAPFGHAA